MTTPHQYAHALFAGSVLHAASEAVDTLASRKQASAPTDADTALGKFAEASSRLSEVSHLLKAAGDTSAAAALDEYIAAATDDFQGGMTSRWCDVGVKSASCREFDANLSKQNFGTLGLAANTLAEAHVLQDEIAQGKTLPNTAGRKKAFDLAQLKEILANIPASLRETLMTADGGIDPTAAAIGGAGLQRYFGGSDSGELENSDAAQMAAAEA